MTKVIMERIILYRNDYNKESVHGIVNIRTQNGFNATFTTIESFEHKIPKGTYIINHCYSPTFDRNLWLVNVPNRTGIRIHPANRGNELRGCIALGLFSNKEQVFQSRRAINILHTILDPKKQYKLLIT